MELYIHLPFCKHKCDYCDFNSYAGIENSVITSYNLALLREIKFAAATYKFAPISTVYLGGGTPSMLDSKVVASLARVIKENFNVCGLKEFTIECNPESLDEEKLAAYRECGINRISLGVQSLNDRNLRSIKRLHDAETAIQKIKLAREFFDNVSCDFIVGLPYDRLSVVKDELTAVSDDVQHISVYALTLEDGTPLKKRVDDGRVLLPDDDEVEDMLELAYAVLKNHGFTRYEISNFAKEGYESKHNLGYWTDEEYLGLGAGAGSYIKTTDGKTKLPNAIRYKEPSDVNAYIAGVNCVSHYEDIPRAEMSVLSDRDVINERIMLGLRTKYGVERELIENRIPPELKPYFNFGERISLNQQGMAVMNSILLRVML